LGFLFVLNVLFKLQTWAPSCVCDTDGCLVPSAPVPHLATACIASASQEHFGAQSRVSVNPLCLVGNDLEQK